MLQEVNGTIREVTSETGMVLTGGTLPTTSGSITSGASNCISTGSYWPSSTVYWGQYPVYVCTDKTKKAIDVLKALEADKLIKCQSVPKFIALVEKIAGLL